MVRANLKNGWSVTAKRYATMAYSRPSKTAQKGGVVSGSFENGEKYRKP